MIDLSQELIFSLLVRSFILGALLGVAYESVRLLRLLIGAGASIKGGRWVSVRRVLCALLTFFTDVLFCLLFAVTALLLTYNLSGGVFRGSVYLLMLAGLIFYRATLGRLLLKLEEKLASVIRKMLRTLFWLIYMPFRAIFLLFVRLYTLTIGKILCKIKCKRRQRHEAKLKEKQKELAADQLPASMEEIKTDVNGSKGYRKEGRISFGERRGA